MDERTPLSELAERISAGDRQAEGSLYTRLRPGVLTMLRVRSQDHALAEDLTQETFRILLERMRSREIEDPEKLSAFVQGIARNLYRDHVRKVIRRDTRSDTDAVESHLADDASAYDAQLQQETHQALQNLLEELNQPRDREILRKTFLLQQDKDEVCAELGISVDHFHRVIFRAKERFAKIVHERRPDLATMEGAP